MKIFRVLLVASAAFFIACTASAQNAGTVTNHAFAIGKGAGVQGYTSLLCASAQLAVGQSAADPICRTLTGDVTLSAAGVTAIGANKVTLGMMATLAADNMVGNPTGSTATPQAFPLVNCSNALTYSTSTHTFGCNATAGTGTVTQVVCGTGLDGGTITATGTCSLSAARRTLPTTQGPFTTGTGATYTTPANVLWIEVWFVGGGGGSGGTGTPGATAGGTGGTTTFNSVTAIGGGGGTISSLTTATPVLGGAGGTGGTGTVTWRKNGAAGGAGEGYSSGTANAMGGIGGDAPGQGGGGRASVTTTPGSAGSTCGGGAGGSGASSGTFGGSGGGGGGEVAYLIIGSPSATYTYTVGAGGTAGTNGTSGSTGAAGGAGCVFVIEHYGT
jgi:hypothetical protein